MTPFTPVMIRRSPIAIPNRLVPLDTMRDLEREGVIGKLHEFVHSTGGAHAAVENATTIGKDIAQRLKAAGVTGVILTST